MQDSTKSSVNTKFIHYTDLEGRHSLPVSIVRSKRRTGSIIVQADGSAQIRIPLRTPDREVDRMLEDRADWIISKHKEMIRREAEAEDTRRAPELTDTQRALLEKRYRKSAADYFALRVQHYERQIGVSHKKIVIRDQKTRWGSCSMSGTLSFNWRLMMAPPDVLDYVVVHELCHFRHMDHSPAFWAAVGNVMPDYKEKRQWLNDHGRELRL